MTTVGAGFLGTLCERAARSPWTIALALCLATHAAHGVEVPYPQAARLALRAALTDGRWRVDDPDLVRAGAFPSWDGALAERATAGDPMLADLDGDGSEERVMRVSPSRDPAPQNDRPGIVLFHRSAGGWRAEVLFRLQPVGTGDRDDYRRPLSADLSLVREGGRTLLVLTVEFMIDGECPNGDRHCSYVEAIALPLTWRRDAMFADTVYAQQSNGSWRGRRLVRACPARDADGRLRDWCIPVDGTIDWEEPFWPQPRAAPRPAWCHPTRGPLSPQPRLVTSTFPTP